MKRHEDALSAVRSVYGDLSRRPLTRNCLQRTECCQFRITGKVPQLTRGEALLAAHAFRASGRKSLPAKKDGSCPLLREENGTCLIYESRPFGCRTHFCQAAGGPMDRQEVVDLIRRLEEIDRLLDGDGPHALAPAMEQALGEI